jgi:hypothetical protein
MDILKKLFGSKHQEELVTDSELYKRVDKASRIADDI